MIRVTVKYDHGIAQAVIVPSKKIKHRASKTILEGLYCDNSTTGR